MNTTNHYQMKVFRLSKKKTLIKVFVKAQNPLHQAHNNKNKTIDQKAVKLIESILKSEKIKKKKLKMKHLIYKMRCEQM